MEKNKRTQIHHTIKEVFHTIASATVDENDKKFIKCSKQNKKSEFIHEINKKIECFVG